MRRQARELALQILFQTEFAPQVPFDEILGVFESSFQSDEIKYADQIISGVKTYKADIDQNIQAVSKNWKLSRISFVDLNILRIAVFEMLYSAPQLKPNIAINEAVEIAKKYGSTESGAFVNGLLDQIASDRDSVDKSNKPH
jgi:N utilization substance protein B